MSKLLLYNSGGWPSPPSRQALCQIRADFSNLWDTSPGGDGLVIFTPYLFALWLTDRARFERWISALHQAGSTHVLVQGWGGRGAPNWDGGGYPGYPIAWIDCFRPDVGLQRYHEMLVHLIRNERLFPILDCAAEGQQGTTGGAYGQQWIVRSLAGALQQLRDLGPSDILQHCGLTLGAELLSDGDHTPDQIQEEHLAADLACRGESPIMSWIGTYPHMGHGARDWEGPGLRRVSIVGLELQGNCFRTYNMPRNGEDSGPCGMEATALYMLGPAATVPFPRTPCQERAPWYLAAPGEYGPRTVCMWETVANGCTHPQFYAPHTFCQPEDRDGLHNFLWTLGFRHFGNGYPSVTS